MLADELRAVLLAHPCVVAWLNGHTHVHAVSAITDGSGAGFWQITTASHIDWPQQARIVEFLAGRLEPRYRVHSDRLGRAGGLRRRQPIRPIWPHSHASSQPTTGRCATSSRPRAAPAPARPPTATWCWRSTGRVRPSRPGSQGRNRASPPERSGHGVVDQLVKDEVLPAARDLQVGRGHADADEAIALQHLLRSDVVLEGLGLDPVQAELAEGDARWSAEGPRSQRPGRRPSGSPSSRRCRTGTPRGRCRSA